MPMHRFKPSTFHNAIGPHAPVLEIADGDSVITETLDAQGFDAGGERRAHGPNPMTGPFMVSGAKPGDGLRVRIDKINLIRSTGWTWKGLGPSVVDPAAQMALPPRKKLDWLIDTNSGTARPKPELKGLENWSVALAPMIGCFGVAPADGQAISTATSGPYGGNMDYRGFGAGVEVLFPVSADGALFFLGDVHAAQGAGEIGGTGIETATEIEFTVRAEKGGAPGWPRGETAQAIFTIGNARPLDQALQHATTEMMT